MVDIYCIVLSALSMDNRYGQSPIVGQSQPQNIHYNPNPQPYFQNPNQQYQPSNYPYSNGIYQNNNANGFNEGNEQYEVNAGYNQHVAMQFME